MTSNELTEKVERLSPDPFVLPRLIHQKVTACSKEHCCGEIRYLWVHAGTMEPPLPMDSWMNVVDEAASLGAEWLVVSLEQASSSFSMLWPLFDWAQKTHGMNVALHMNTPTLCQADHAELLNLDRSHAFLFVPTSQIGLYWQYSEAGLTVKSCDPESSEMELCKMPGNMLFVTASGKLYTCGMVHGDEDFCLGHVNMGLFSEIIQDTTVPHAVGKDAMKRENGCMGCPPLVLQNHA